MKKYIKIFSLTLCVVLCLSVLLSAGYVVHSSYHNCIGKDCHICQTGAALKKLLSSVGICCLKGTFALCLIQLTDAVSSIFSKARKSYSLVGDKVKLTA